MRSQELNIKQLKAEHPYMTLDDIAELTGYPPAVVKKALEPKK